MRRVSSFLFAVCCVAWIQCIDGAVIGPSRHIQVLTSLAENVTLTRYSELEQRAAVLSLAADTLCDDLTAERLDAARDAWWDAREPWKRTEIVKFGPVVEYPTRMGPKLDDWPVNGPAVEDLVASDGPLDQDAFDAMGAATRGFPVVEYLLWSGEGDTLESLAADTRRCEVLAGAAADLAANAMRLREVWEQDWMVQLGDPVSVPESAYDITQEIVDEWVNRMAFTVENIRVTKLGKPAGDKADGEPQLDTLESRPSGRSLVDARDALAGVYDVWTGDVSEGTLGIQDLIRDVAVTEDIEALFQAAITELDGVPETLEATILGDPDAVAQAQAPLLELQAALQEDLAGAVDATITFNDADGD